MDSLNRLYTEYDTRDHVLLGQNPTLMMPRFGDLPELRVGQRRYVMAQDGLYVQSKSSVMCVTVRIVETPPMPYGPLSPSVTMIGGLVPLELVNQFKNIAREVSPTETAAFIVWNKQRYEYVLLSREVVSASAGHISYLVDDIDRDSIVCNWHSHGTMNAYFSTTDDASDIDGLYFASVFGQCSQGQTMEIVSRLVIDGLHIPLKWHPWNDHN